MFSLRSIITVLVCFGLCACAQNPREGKPILVKKEVKGTDITSLGRALSGNTVDIVPPGAPTYDIPPLPPSSTSAMDKKFPPDPDLIVADKSVIIYALQKIMAGIGIVEEADETPTDISALPPEIEAEQLP